MGRPADDLAHAAALASLPGVGPAVLRSWVARFDGAEAWHRARSGELFHDVARHQPAAVDRTELRRRFVASASALDPVEWWQGHAARGMRGAVLGRAGYPVELARDRDAPGVVFWLGSLEALGFRRVTVVGTRQPTAVGRDVARQLGHDLAAAGVCVISGLALGVDGAAHDGAVAAAAAGGAPPLAVVGSGLDRVYPRRHAGLWRQVAEHGAVLSEVAPGGAPEPWRFPQRNRMLAALGEVLVVVESRRAGGSLLTVEQANDRGRPVLAVPGSVRSPASEGTNQLLYDGCSPARDATDVLVALGLTPSGGSGRASPPVEGRVERAVLEAVAGGPVDVDGLRAVVDADEGAVALALMNLELRGAVVRRGAWVEPRGTRP